MELDFSPHILSTQNSPNNSLGEVPWLLTQTKRIVAIAASWKGKMAQFRCIQLDFMLHFIWAKSRTRDSLNSWWTLLLKSVRKLVTKKKCEKISQNLKCWSQCLRQVCAFRRNLTDSKVAPLGVNNLNLTTKLLLFTNVLFSPSIWYTVYFSNQQVVVNLISAKTTNWNPNFLKQIWR